MRLYDYKGNILNQSKYNGKKISILGDSISTYSGYIPSGNKVWYTGSNSGVASVDETWWKRVIDYFGMELLVNNSWSGSRVTTTNGESSAGCMTRCESLGDAPDIIIVFMGANDFNNEVVIGTYDGTGDFPTTTTTFREAYAIMLNKILTKYKIAEVYVCTLLPCESSGSIGFPESNGNGVLWRTLNDTIIELANLFGVKVLENHKCGLTYQNMDIYMGDYVENGRALHPNAEGHKLIADHIIKTLEK